MDRCTGGIWAYYGVISSSNDQTERHHFDEETVALAGGLDMEDTRHENRSWRHGSRLQACEPRGNLLVF